MEHDKKAIRSIARKMGSQSAVEFARASARPETHGGKILSKAENKKAYKHLANSARFEGKHPNQMSWAERVGPEYIKRANKRIPKHDDYNYKDYGGRA